MGQFKQILSLGSSSSKKYGIDGGGNGDKDVCERDESTGNIGGKGNCRESGCRGISMISGIGGKVICGGSGCGEMPVVPGICEGEGGLCIV